MNCEFEREEGPGLCLKKVWEDDDLIQLSTMVADDQGCYFRNEVYVVLSDLRRIVDEMESFRRHSSGQFYDLNIGSSDSAIAGGQFRARFHFFEVGKLAITTYQRREFREFSGTQIAAEARLYLRTEPSLLDSFVIELSSLPFGSSGVQAVLECTKLR